MQFDTTLGAISIDIKSGEMLYGRISMEGEPSALEIWVCEVDGLETAAVTVQSSDFGLVGFNFHPKRGFSIGAYNNLHSLLFTRTKLYRAARLLLDEFEKDPFKRMNHFLEGILLSISLKAPSAIRGALTWDPGELQISLFGTHQGMRSFEHRHTIPTPPGFFENWIFYNRIQDEVKFDARATAKWNGSPAIV